MKYFKLMTAMFVVSYSMSSHGILVIIQDPEVLKARKQQEQLLVAEKLMAKKETEISLKRAEQAKERKLKIQSEAASYDKKRFTVIADRTEKVITHFGAAPQNLAAIGGGGLDIPFWLAMNSIVPKGWKVLKDKKINPQVLVSWSGYQANWVAVLYKLGVEVGLVYDIDWNKQEVIVRKRVSVTDRLKEEYLSKQ